MRVLMISKACVVGTYQRKLEEIARLGVDLSVIVPPMWADPAGTIPLERLYTDGYQLLVEPMWFNGNFHLYHHPTLDARMAELRPDIVHIDEEPYNAATFHALQVARYYKAEALFFSWQNLNRRYPPPFKWIEGWTLRNVDYALMGTQSAAEVWREKGYRGRLAVLPQFGVDPDLFTPSEADSKRNKTPFVIGYIGRLVPEKGVDRLLRALPALRGAWCVRIVGQGPERANLEALAVSLGVAERIEWAGQLPSAALPEVYRSLSVLVIPSRTMPNWKEQFGRVIIEANACGVPVIGSDSGAIPGLIDAGGLTFPENEIASLTERLQTLIDDPAQRKALGMAGRAQVLARYTHGQIAAETVAVYREMLGANY